MSNENKEHIKNNLKQKSGLWISIIIVGLFSLFIFYIYEYNIFNFRHNVFIKGAKMNFYHNGPAVLLNDGNVLIIGGDTKQAEIYDYKKNKFVLVNEKMNYLRKYGASATKLNDGTVLIAGGVAKENHSDIDSVTKKIRLHKEKYVIPDNAEIYNPIKSEYVITGSMCHPRTMHGSILTDNGNVLFFGGVNSKGKVELSVEEYDYKLKKFRVLYQLPNYDYPSINVAKFDKNKYIIIYQKTGNYSSDDFKILIYDYSTNKIYYTNEVFLNKKTYKKLIGPVKFIDYTNSPIKPYVLYLEINDGKILVVPKSAMNRIEYALLNINDHTSILAGGIGKPKFWGMGDVTNKSSMITTDSFDFTDNKAILKIKRFKHSAIKLNDGNFLIFGGYRNNTGKNLEKLKVLDSEIYYK